MITIAKLWARLRNRKYRNAFAVSQFKRGIPFQIKALRKRRGWSQQRLADLSGLPQGTISRAEDLNYGDLSFNTVLRIANGFDVAFVGRFVPFSELARWYTSLSDELHVPTFEEEDVGHDEDAAFEPVGWTAHPTGSLPKGIGREEGTFHSSVEFPQFLVTAPLTMSPPSA